MSARARRRALGARGALGAAGRQRRRALCAGAALLAAACAARLSSAPGDGVRLRAPAPFVVTKHALLLDKNQVACGEQRTSEFVSLPLGEPYALNVDTHLAWFASNELGIEFYESGALKQVTLNSDPQVDETLRASADLVGETSRLVTSIAAIGASAAAAEPDAKSCGQRRDERILCVVPLEDWLQSPNACPAETPAAAR